MIESHGMRPKGGSAFALGGIFVLAGILLIFGGIVGVGSFAPMASILQPVYATAGEHGIAMSASCIKVELGEMNDCTFTVRNNSDDFGDTMRLERAVTTVGISQVEFGGVGADMEIDFVSFVPSGDQCVVGGTLPCEIPTGGRVRIHDQSHTTVTTGINQFFPEIFATDLCDGVFDLGCSNAFEGQTASGNVQFFVVDASVTIDKAANPTKVLADSDVTYTYTIENTGNVSLDCEVTDDQLGLIGGAVIPAGATEVFNANAIITVDTINVGTVICDHQLGEVDDGDDATVTVVEAAVTIDKTVDPTKVLAGTTVTYTYTIENVGPTDLENCNVNDDQLGFIGSADLLSGASAQFTTDTAINADTTNIATVECDFQLGTIGDEDDATVEVIAPALSVTKECEPTTQTAPGTITWTVNINNDGDTTLAVVAFDDQNPAQPIFDGDIAAGATETIVYDTTNLAAGTYTNTVLVTAEHQLGELEASDTAECEVTGAEGAVFLKIDEDSIDNGIHFNRNGGNITPNGPQFFSKTAVNDDKPGEQQRDVLRYFARNVGNTITVVTGQTGDEGWFAPTCIPQKWLYGLTGDEEFDNECLTGAERDLAIDNYFGMNGENNVPPQEVLDKVPHVEPLRALGLNALVGKTVCAVVYDSDNSVNYDHDKDWLGVNDNMQGETLGIVAFVVVETKTLNGFSSSTLPQVTLTIVSTEECGNWTLFNAPVPESSSVPNDRIAPGSPAGYRALKVWPSLDLFF